VSGYVGATVAIAATRTGSRSRCWGEKYDSRLGTFPPRRRGSSGSIVKIPSTAGTRVLANGRLTRDESGNDSRTDVSYTEYVATPVIASFAVIVAVLAGSTFVARRHGYKVGGRVIVRCRKGHLFTTIWLPGVSLKAVRLSWMRWQRCPVGHHWSLVVPVKDDSLSEQERRTAAEQHDIPIL